MWEQYKLSQVCKIISGNSIPAKRKEELFAGAEGMPYVATKDVGFDGSIDYQNGIYIPDEHLKDFKVSPVGATLICAEGGSAGRKIAFSSEKCCYVNKLFSLQASEVIFPKFLYYYALSNEFQSQFKEAMHGLIGGVSLSKIKDFTISVSPLAEQQRIVAKLDAIFAGIDEAIELSQRQIIEVSKFGYRAISNSLENLRQNFGRASLIEVAVIQPKKKLALKKIGEKDQVSFMSMDGLGIEKKYSESEIKKPLKEVYKSYQYFENDDVIFAKITPCFENGKLGIVRNLNNGIGFGSSEFVVLRPNSTIKSEFLYYCLLDEVFRKEGVKNMLGAVGQKRVNKDYFQNYEVPLPSIDAQDSLVQKLDEIWRNTAIVVSTKQKKIGGLNALKSAILRQELQSEVA